MKGLIFLFVFFCFITVQELMAQEGLDDFVVTQDDMQINGNEDSEGDSLWDFSGNLALTFSQISFTNWAAGGEDAFTGNSSVLLTANYDGPLNRWENTLDLGFGLTQQGDGDDKRRIKNEDKIDFASQYGRWAASKWFYSVYFGFRTQFYKGYAYPDDSTVVSDLMTPAYMMVSLGMDYKPTEKINVLISPISGRLTVVNDQRIADKGLYGVTPAELNEAGEVVVPGHTSRAELGGFIKIQYQQNFFDDKFGLRTRLELFSNYLDKPQNVDVLWDLALNFNLGNYITARVQTQLLYNEDVLDEIQFREVLGVGLSYSF